MTEYELIKGCIRQDIACQRMLFEQLAGKMFTVCLRYANDYMEAEDMLQDGFVRVFNNLHQFKFEGSFEGWVRRVIVNCSLKHLQKKRIQFTELKESYFDTHHIDSYAYSNLGEEELLKLISQLPDGYRIVFNLNIIEGYTHDEIAKLLNIQPSTSRSQLVKARKMLQSQIIQLQKIAV
ncbi:MAG: sigma-70 family RNA polymerase sigma factor [Chitinophagaceae bacterium]|nr:sigma-70 family RNA polymerase sigma factor [Chitinophagaceae bacterium]